MYHYVYRITNLENRKHYYGSRSSKIAPHKDLGVRYFSSSRNGEFIQDQLLKLRKYRYKIIRHFSTREEALRMEIKLHARFDVGINPSFYNEAKQTNTGFDTTGKIFANGTMMTIQEFYDRGFTFHSRQKVTIKTPDGITKQVAITDPRYISGEYISVATGMVNAINKDGMYEWVTQDDYYARNLTCNNTGKVPVKNNDGEYFLVEVDDPRYKHGDLIHPTVGMVSARNLKTGEIVQVTTKEFETDDNLVGVNAGKIEGDKNPNAKVINIYNTHGDLLYTCIGNFKHFCHEHNFPFASLQRSLKTQTGIYSSDRGKKEAKERGMEKFIGWYAQIENGGKSP